VLQSLFCPRSSFPFPTAGFLPIQISIQTKVLCGCGDFHVAPFFFGAWGLRAMVLCGFHDNYFKLFFDPSQKSFSGSDKVWCGFFSFLPLREFLGCFCPLVLSSPTCSHPCCVCLLPHLFLVLPLFNVFYFLVLFFHRSSGFVSALVLKWVPFWNFPYPYLSCHHLSIFFGCHYVFWIMDHCPFLPFFCDTFFSWRVSSTPPETVSDLPALFAWLSFWNSLGSSGTPPLQLPPPHKIPFPTDNSPLVSGPQKLSLTASFPVLFTKSLFCLFHKLPPLVVGCPPPLTSPGGANVCTPLTLRSPSPCFCFSRVDFFPVTPR